MIEFGFEVVGGPFDGAELEAPAWIDDGAHPPPEVIFVGQCRGGACGSSRCRSRGGGFVHVSYWQTFEPRRPPGAAQYRQRDAFVKRDDAGVMSGRAVYVIGGMMEPGNFGERARVPEGKVPA